MKRGFFYRITGMLLGAALVTGTLIMPVQAKGRKNELTSITVNTFSNPDGIRTLNIGRSVEQISSNAFVNMTNLQSITVSSANRYYSSYSGCLYDKDRTTLLCFPQALTSAYIPDTAVAVGQHALDGVDSKLKKSIKSAIATQEETSEKKEGNKKGITGPHLVFQNGSLLWDDGRGRLRTPDSALLKAAADVVSGAADEKEDREEMLEDCYDYLLANTELVPAGAYPSGSWTADKALDALTTGSADTYGFAAAFAYLARSLGFNARVISGTAQGADGLTRAGAWTQVQIDGIYYAFDPAMEKDDGGNYYMMDTANTDSRRSSASFTVSF